MTDNKMTNDEELSSKLLVNNVRAVFGSLVLPDRHDCRQLITVSYMCPQGYCGWMMLRCGDCISAAFETMYPASHFAVLLQDPAFDSPADKYCSQLLVRPNDVLTCMGARRYIWPLHARIVPRDHVGSGTKRSMKRNKDCDVPERRGAAPKRPKTPKRDQKKRGRDSPADRRTRAEQDADFLGLTIADPAALRDPSVQESLRAAVEEEEGWVDADTVVAIEQHVREADAPIVGDLEALVVSRPVVTEIFHGEYMHVLDALRDCDIDYDTWEHSIDGTFVVVPDPAPDCDLPPTPPPCLLCSRIRSMA